MVIDHLYTGVIYTRILEDWYGCCWP